MTKPTALDLGRNAKQAMSVAMQQVALMSDSRISQNPTHPNCIPIPW